MILVLESVRRDGAESVLPCRHHRKWHPIRDRNAYGRFSAPYPVRTTESWLLGWHETAVRPRHRSVRCTLLPDGLMFGDQVAEQFCRVSIAPRDPIEDVPKQILGLKRKSVNILVTNSYAERWQLIPATSLTRSATLLLSVPTRLGIHRSNSFPRHPAHEVTILASPPGKQFPAFDETRPAVTALIIQRALFIQG